MAEDLCLKLQNGTQLFVPNRLDAITTYVILEQERWFEKEWGFIPHLLRPGMTAIDIGANLGIFSMAMARAVGAAGRVYAYEPTSETRARLEKSKAINGAENIVVVGSALSDTEREGRIVFGASSELNRLGDDADGMGEAVHLTSLDLERRRHGWGEIDFIKMDAEGEELKIIAGGRSVFEAGSPVVMFEIRSETGYEPRIAQEFEALGYGLYRLLPDERHLVPFVEAELDGLELNLFAVKPERARELAERGLLAEDRGAPAIADGTFRRFAEARRYFGIAPALFGRAGNGSKMMRGLDAYAVWRDETRQISERYAALKLALEQFGAAAEDRRDLATLLNLARANNDAGHRGTAYERLVEAMRLMDAGTAPEAPFVPPTLRHEEEIGDTGTWLTGACVDAAELLSKYSSFHSGVIPQLDWLCGTSQATIAMERRRALSAAVRGKALTLRKDLRVVAPDHLNAETWAKLIGQ